MLRVTSVKQMFMAAVVAGLIIPAVTPHGFNASAQAQVTAVVKPAGSPPMGKNANGTHTAVVAPATPATPSGKTAAGSSGVKAIVNATTGTETVKAPTTQPAPAPANNSWFTFLMLGAAAILVIMLIRGPRKEEKKRKQMLATMKKGSRVVTIGGLVGSVVDVRDDVVVLKVDESANVKAHYLKSAISRVLAEDDSPEEKKA